MAAIVGGVLGALLLVVVVAILIVMAVGIYQRKRRKESGVLSLLCLNAHAMVHCTVPHI